MVRRGNNRWLSRMAWAAAAAGLLSGCSMDRPWKRFFPLSTIPIQHYRDPHETGEMPDPYYGTPGRSASLVVHPEVDVIADDGGEPAEPVGAAAPEDVNQVVAEEEDIVSEGDHVVAESDEEFLAQLLAVEEQEPAAPPGAESDEPPIPPRDRPLRVPPPPAPPALAEAVQEGRLHIPSELPGSEAKPLRVPPFDPLQPLEERKQEIENLYPKLPPLPILAAEAPEMPTWTLRELEEIAWENHPGLTQAAAQVEVARGATIQAGLHPNPTFGWEQDTIGPGIQGYKGPYLDQEIVTGGKLKLARSAASMDFENAQIAYQRTRIEIATQVRSAYFGLLVSEQRHRMLLALSRFTDEIYRAQIELTAGGQAAPYEPLNVRVFAVQARNDVIGAHNDVIAAQRQLGAATGMFDVETFRVAGEAERPPAVIDYQPAKAYLLENHTDLRSTRNLIVQAQYNSRLEYIRPRIPNVKFYGAYQHAYGVPPFVNSYNFQVGAPLPIFDRNQGNILSTQSAIISQNRAYSATQLALINQLAAVLARYDTARAQAHNYRHDMLPDHVRTYRGVYTRYREGGQGVNDNINFGDIIVAQQTLSATVAGYADVLNQVWQAYVELANLLQVEDLSQLEAWFGAAP